MPEHIDLNSLKTETPPLISYKPANLEVVIIAGKEIKVEGSPDGDEFVSGIVPDGKIWTVKMAITIDETDA